MSTPEQPRRLPPIEEAEGSPLTIAQDASSGGLTLEAINLDAMDDDDEEEPASSPKIWEAGSPRSRSRSQGVQLSPTVLSPSPERPERRGVGHYAHAKEDEFWRRRPPGEEPVEVPSRPHPTLTLTLSELTRST